MPQLKFLAICQVMPQELLELRLECVLFHSNTLCQIDDTILNLYKVSLFLYIY